MLHPLPAKRAGMLKLAFPIGVAVPLLALAAFVPQSARAFTVPARECTTPAPQVLESSELSKLDSMRIQQEADYATPRCAVAVIAPALGVAFPLLQVAVPAPDLDVEPTISADRPDIFGSTALPISHTPLDAKWRAATATPLSLHSKLWSSLVRSAASEDRATRLETINHWVNAHIAFAADRSRRGTADQWASARETLRRGAGDCEDYAIAKMKLLEAAGIARSDLYLVIARDLVRRADHAILAVRLGGQLMILDSSTDQILDSKQVTDYRPIFSFGAQGSWVHGYTEQPVRLASAL
jgi:predicted transglutaminase-like cysteine proteinase